jgi:large subunit ribosomal protein L6
MRLPEISRTIPVPDGVTVSIKDKKVTVKGSKATLARDFSYAPISLDVNGNKVQLTAQWPRKKESAMVGTIESHIKNMITGVTKGYTYKLKIVFLSLSNHRKNPGKSFWLKTLLVNVEREKPRFLEMSKLNLKATKYHRSRCKLGTIIKPRKHRNHDTRKQQGSQSFFP